MCCPKAAFSPEICLSPLDEIILEAGDGGVQHVGGGLNLGGLHDLVTPFSDLTYYSAHFIIFSVALCACYYSFISRSIFALFLSKNFVISVILPKNVVFSRINC
jgi:hypothetical protein